MRRPLWDQLTSLADSIQSAWCILDDFNSILNPHDMIGGDKMLESEIREFCLHIKSCEIQEMRSVGSSYLGQTEQIMARE